MDKSFELQGIQFEWDEEKYAANLWKHRVKFEEAAEVFFDPFLIYDDVSVEEEQRKSIMGFSFSAKAFFVVFVERGLRTRIVSARPATSQERNKYAKENFGR